MTSNRVRLITSLAIGVAVIALLTTWALHAYRKAEERLQQQLQRYRQEWIDTQLRDLGSGASDTIHFYDTQQTNDLMKVFEGMPEVRRLEFELTDISEDGMEIVARFPNLRELILYGGRPNVDDNGLRYLSGHTELETLELVNTDVTDRGLDVLAKLPKLRSLTLYREDFREVTLTEKGLLSLQNLDNLEELTIDGGWASDEAIRKLQANMPNCKISTDSDW